MGVEGDVRKCCPHALLFGGEISRISAQSKWGKKMNNNTLDRRAALRLSALLLLVGQILYVLVTLLHTGGDANNHPVIFASYAASDTWTAVHVAQFFCTAILLAGLLGLSSRSILRPNRLDGLLVLLPHAR